VVDGDKVYNEIDFTRVNEVKLDKTEREVIKLLQRDGRMSFVDMAREIGVTEGTIRRKFNRLMDEQILKIAAVANPFVIGFHTPAWIGLNVEADRLQRVVEQLSNLERVRYVATTTGIFDIIIEGYFSDNQDLYRFILEDLARIEGLTDTQTALLLHVYKNTFEVGVAVGPS